MKSASSRWLIGVGAVIAVLVVASVLVAVFGGSGKTATFPGDTPEGVVQRYLQALEDNDSQAAFDYLGAELQEGCTLLEFRNQTNWIADQDHRIVLEGTELLETQTLVMVRISQIRTDPPFSTSESSFRQGYTLEQQNGDWRFTEPPWPLSFCQDLTHEAEKLPLPRN